MMDVQIFELGSAPEQDLRDAFELHRTLQLEMSPGHKSLSYEATIASWKSIVDYCQTRHWVARVDNRIVGIAKTEIEIREDNQDQAWLDVNVLPEFRRRGIGAALARPALVHAASCSRTLIGAEAGQDHPGEEFLTFLGLTKRLLWRVSRVHMDAIPPALMHKWISAASAIAELYELVRWVGPCPDEYVGELVLVTTLMNTAPREGLAMEDEVWSPDMIRAADARLLAADIERWTVAACHKATQKFVGFTEMNVYRLDPSHAEQENTVVHPGHRNKGIGRWIKAVMIETLRAQRPMIDTIDTGNAAGNQAMLSINEQMGFRTRCAIADWQGEVSTALHALENR